MAKGGNLGKASLILTTKDETKPGLNKSEGGIKSWAGGMRGKVAGALAGIGASIAAFASVSKLFERTADLSAVGKQAAALGIASDTFMGLSAAAKQAGVEGEQFGTLLQKAQVKIAEGSPDVQAALSSVGLSLEQLRGKTPDQIFYAVADGMAGVSDQGARALAATKLFEEEGAKLLPVLGRGSAGLKEFVAQQKAMGAALSQSDMDSVLHAQARITQLGERVEGVMNRMVVAALPFLEVGLDITDAIIGMMPPFEDVKYFGLATLQALGVAGAYVWDTLKAGVGGFTASAGIATAAVGKLMHQMGMKEGAGVNAAGMEMAKWGFDQVGGFGNSAKAVESFFANIGKAAPKVGEKIGKAAGEQMAKSFAFEYRQNPALERGTAEEYSARVRWESGQMTLQQQQVRKAEEIAKNTAATVNALQNLPHRLNLSPVRIGKV